MDNNRFDSLTRSIAAWTSRRKVLAGLIGLAAGGALSQPGAVSAQAATPDARSGPGDQKLLEGIQNDSLNILKTLPPPSAFRKERNSALLTQPAFEQFVGHLQVLFKRGSRAADEKWSQRETDLYIQQVASVIPSVSIGFSGAFFSDQAPTETAALKLSGTCTGQGCIAACLHPALLCFDHCNGNDPCNYACVAPFITCLVGDSTKPGNPACLESIRTACDGVDCCSGNCH